MTSQNLFWQAVDCVIKRISDCISMCVLTKMHAMSNAYIQHIHFSTALVPPGDGILQKRIRNLRKEEARKKKERQAKRKQGGKAEDSEDEDFVRGAIPPGYCVIRLLFFLVLFKNQHNRNFKSQQNRNLFLLDSTFIHAVLSSRFLFC